MNKSQDHLFFEEDHTIFYNKSILESKNENSLVKYTENKNRKIFWFNKDQQNHHDTNPAIIEMSEKSNKIIMWQYIKNGFYHKTDKPAIVDKNGINPYCSWYFNGVLHRIGGFAEMQINTTDNQKPSEEYYNLFINHQKYEDPIDYFKAAQIWLIKNTDAHHCLEAIENLHEKISIGYLNKNNWKNGIFQK